MSHQGRLACDAVVAASIYPPDMTPESMVQAAVATITSLGTVAGVAGRRRRLRGEIKENLVLIGDLEKSEVLREHTPVVGWLQGKVMLDVAKLANVKLDTGKTPIAWGSVASTAILLVVFGGWTYWIDRDGYVWYSVFPGIVAFLMFIAILGLTTNRQKPPERTAEEAPDADGGESDGPPASV